MKKTIFTLFMFSFILNANSQEVKKMNADVFKPGWYIGANGGINLFFAEGNKFYQTKEVFAFSLSDNSGFIGRGELGFDFTPFFGIRGMLANAKHYWPDVRFTNPNGTYKVESFGSESLTADLMFNLSNGFAGYNSNRFFNLSVFGGIGVAHRDKASFPSDFYTGILRGGVQGSFRLSSQFDLDVIADGNAVGDNFNNLVAGFPFDIYSTLTVGLTYHFRDKSEKPNTITVIEKSDKLETKKSDTVSKDTVTKDTVSNDTVRPIVQPTVQQSVEPNAEPIVEPVTSTNQKTGNLAVKKQTNKPLVEQSQPSIGHSQAATGHSKVAKDHSKSANQKLTVNIFYPLNETHIDQEKQKEAIAKVVEFMKMYPNARIVVRGYGDKDTGTHAVNYVISNNRAENVTSLLIKTYDIKSNRIKTRAVGCSYQPFKQDNMNRLVVVTSEL